MNNMYEILNKFKSVADIQQLDTSKKPTTKTINEAASKQINEVGDTAKGQAALTSYRHKARDSELRNKETARRDTEISQQARDPRVAAKSAAYAVQAQATADKRRAGQEKATSRLSKEGKIKESTMMESALDMILQQHSKDFDAFKQGGDLSDSLYNSLYDYYFDDMPYGVKKARTGDPYEWISQRLHDEMGLGEGNRFAFNVLKAKQKGLKKADLDGDGDLETVREANKTMSPKQKKFAALADPTNKITYADKIAGAKKSSGMQEAKDDDDYYGTKKSSHKTSSGGTVTRQGGVTKHQAAPGRYGGYDAETDPDKDDEKTDKPAGEKRGRGRPKKTNKEPERVTAKAYKHKGGRKVKEEMGHDNDMINLADRGEYDREGDMADEQLHTIEDAARELQSIIDAEDNLPEWVQSKITKAMDYIDTARDYMHSKDAVGEGYVGFAKLEKQIGKNPKVKNPAAVAAKIGRDKYGQKEMTRRSVAGRKNESMDEEAVSGAQQMAAAIALKAKRAGKKPRSGTASAQMAKMPTRELEKFAKTKRSDLPKHVGKKSKSMDENTVAGGIAPSTASSTAADTAAGAYKQMTAPTRTAPSMDKVKSAAPSGNTTANQAAAKMAPTSAEPAPKKAAKTNEADKPAKNNGMIFGKGVYEGKLAESLENKLSLLAEGMSVNASVGEDGTSSLSVNATNEDAVKLAEILKLAGLGHSDGYQEVCPACGHEPCGCDDAMSEDLANSPDTVTTDQNYMVNTLSGGLNGPKTTGQTTIPVLNRDPRRQVTAENIENQLWNVYARYNNK